MQIYKILREYKYSSNVNHFIAINWRFRHNYFNIWNLNNSDRTNGDLLLVLMNIANKLPRTHFNETKLDWIDKSMTINLSYSGCGLLMRKNNYYEAINAMVGSLILFRLPERGKYLVNPYILNVLSQAQAEHIISNVAHDTPPVF
jgi:hypothetical protein